MGEVRGDVGGVGKRLGRCVKMRWGAGEIREEVWGA